MINRLKTYERKEVDGREMSFANDEKGVGSRSTGEVDRGKRDESSLVLEGKEE